MLNREYPPPLPTYAVVDQVYSHSSRYIEFFDGETEAARRQSLYKWTMEMRENGAWADQLFINAIARAHMVSGGGRPGAGSRWG